jgi:hypothetical protein
MYPKHVVIVHRAVESEIRWGKGGSICPICNREIYLVTFHHCLLCRCYPSIPPSRIVPPTSPILFYPLPLSLPRSMPPSVIIGFLLWGPPGLVSTTDTAEPCVDRYTPSPFPPPPSPPSPPPLPLTYFLMTNEPYHFPPPQHSTALRGYIDLLSSGTSFRPKSIPGSSPLFCLSLLFPR